MLEEQAHNNFQRVWVHTQCVSEGPSVQWSRLIGLGLKDFVSLRFFFGVSSLVKCRRGGFNEFNAKVSGSENFLWSNVFLLSCFGVCALIGREEGGGWTEGKERKGTEKNRPLPDLYITQASHNT